jgi:arylsulfatase A-like enzyme
MGAGTGALTMGPQVVGSEVQPRQNPPNVLFILTDQHRQDGVGAYGRVPVETPNLDRLANEGIRFNNAYTAQPVCAPNRASLLTSLYPHTHGLRENTWPLTPRARTLAHLLAAHGYACGYFGKWHLGRQNSQGFATFPDYPCDGRGSNHYFTIDGRKRYAVDVLTEDLIDFITSDRESPFFACASFYPPHPPYSVPQEYEEMYTDLFPDDRERQIYYAMCTKVDEQIGRLLTTLERHGLHDNTLVVFTSEHGHYFDFRWNQHRKRLCYDVAARVPLLMRMPETIRPDQVSTELISAVDLMPTILGLLEFDVPEGLQGMDLSAMIRGDEETSREAVFMENFPFIDKGETPGPYPNEPRWGYGEERCVRGREWKLILSTVRPPELYRMAEDPDEQNNRWDEMKHTADVISLLEHLNAWAVETGDSLAPRLMAHL